MPYSLQADRSKELITRLVTERNESEPKGWRDKTRSMLLPMGQHQWVYTCLSLSPRLQVISRWVCYNLTKTMTQYESPRLELTYPMYHIVFRLDWRSSLFVWLYSPGVYKIIKLPIHKNPPYLEVVWVAEIFARKNTSDLPNHTHITSPLQLPLMSNQTILSSRRIPSRTGAVRPCPKY